MSTLQIPFLILNVFLCSAILDFKEVFIILRISRLISRVSLMFSLKLETVFEVEVQLF
jgi:hypothetical protein